jgi:asparagine synthase (glutamine-hydrolysing)
MCGLVGYIDTRTADGENAMRALIGAMADTLWHRGPDDFGAWTDPAAGVAFGFRRLSIIDLTPTGHQPMSSADGRFVIVYNGEIYNYRDLAADLRAAGYPFRSQSDTEVILAGLVHWGLQATVRRLIGMFAFAVWDRRDRELTLVRDRLGIKPMVYGETGPLFLFGSDLRALRRHPDCPAAIDRDAAASFLSRNYVAAPNTIYRGLSKLEPGCILRYRPGGAVRVEAYWRLGDSDDASGPAALGEDDVVAALDPLLSDAVGRSMVSDVPVGVLLSGGVDSSAVASLMQENSPRPIHSFSIGFTQASHDESVAAKAVARHLGTDHTEWIASPKDALDLVPRIVDWFDEPFADASQIPSFMVAAMARKQVTVVLSGDGGDEVFAGYNRYLWADRWGRRLSRLPRAVRSALAGVLSWPRPAVWDAATVLWSPGRRPRGLADKIGKAAMALTCDDADAVHDRITTHWLEPPVIGGRIRSARHDPPATHPIRRMQYRDTMDYLPNDILTKVDRTGMAASVEARVPLLDHRVVEFAWRLPVERNIAGGVSKRLLRRVLYKRVPQALVDRPKTGFAPPLAEWLRGPLRDWAEDLLSGDRLSRQGLVDAAPVRRVWEDHRSGRRNHQHSLWGVLMLQAWAERHRPAA